MDNNENKSEYKNIINEDEFDLYKIWVLIKKRGFLLIAITGIFTISACIYAFVSPKVYSVSNMLSIYQLPINDLNNQSKSDVNIINNPEAITIINNLKYLSKIQVAEALGLDKKNLKSINLKSIKVKNIKDTALISISIDSLNKADAETFINKLPDYIQEYPYIKNRIETQKSLLMKNGNELKSIIDNPEKSLNLNGKSALIKYLSDLSDLKQKYNNIETTVELLNSHKIVMLADKTTLPDIPVRPNKKIVIILGILTGFIAGLFIIFIIDSFFNHKQRTE